MVSQMMSDLDMMLSDEEGSSFMSDASSSEWESGSVEGSSAESRATSSDWETASTSDAEPVQHAPVSKHEDVVEGQEFADAVSDDDWGRNGLRSSDTAFLLQFSGPEGAQRARQGAELVRGLADTGVPPEMVHHFARVLHDVGQRRQEQGVWNLNDVTGPPESFWNRSPPKHICGAPGQGGLQPPEEVTCTDPNCFEHSKFRILRVTVHDNRDVIMLDLDALIDSGAQLVVLEGFETYVSVCLLQHEGRLDQLAVRLHCSAVQAIEFNFGDVNAQMVRQNWAIGMGSSRPLTSALETLSTALAGKWTMQSLVQGEREEGVSPDANTYVFFRITDMLKPKIPTVESA